jgi:chromosome segregation ATPase
VNLGPDATKLQSALEELKGRLQQEREAFETLTRQLAVRREQNSAAEDARLKKLNQELAIAVRQVADHKEEAESFRRQLARQRAESIGLMRKLERELGKAEDRLREERAARAELERQAEAGRSLIEQLTAERDESRQQLSEVESRTGAVEEEFAAAQEQFRAQREAAAHVIEYLEQELNEPQGRLSELEARVQWLEEELAAARDKLISVPLSLLLLSTDLLAGQFQADPAMVETVRLIHSQSQKLLEEVQGQQERVSLAPDPPERARASSSASRHP